MPESPTVAAPTPAFARPAAARPQGAWSQATLVAFRLGFCYLMEYALGCGNSTLWGLLPWVGRAWVERGLAWPYQQVAGWVGVHGLGLAAARMVVHGGGSGDRALDWLVMAVMAAAAVLATVVWTAVELARPEAQRATSYPRLLGLLRLTLRLTLGVTMLNYGLVKLFPLQMPMPSLAVLNERVGSLSPMTLLWTMLGSQPMYEAVLGGVEFVAAGLVWFRRTALAGGLLLVVVLSQVALYNWFFDVPVKGYSLNLLLMAVVLVLPDAGMLLRLLFLHRAGAPTERWSPWSSAVALSWETWVLAALLLATAGFTAWRLDAFWSAQQLALAHPPALTGEWRVADPARTLLTGSGSPVAELMLDPDGRGMLRGTDGSLWRCGLALDAAAHTLRVDNYARRSQTVLQVQSRSAEQLQATVGGASVTLTRVPLPQHYPLLESPSHWVNEWGVER